MSSLKTVFAVLAMAAALASGGADAAVPGPVDVNVVNAPARQPFMLTRSCVTNGQRSCRIEIAVPADKTLVIEHVSMNGSNDYDEQAIVQVSADDGGEGANFWLPAVLMADGYNVLSESLRIYSDAGSKVILATVFPSAVRGSVAMSLGGYLVDCATEYLCGGP